MLQTEPQNTKENCWYQGRWLRVVLDMMNRASTRSNMRILVSRGLLFDIERRLLVYRELPLSRPKLR